MFADADERLPCSPKPLAPWNQQVVCHLIAIKRCFGASDGGRWSRPDGHRQASLISCGTNGSARHRADRREASSCVKTMTAGARRPLHTTQLYLDSGDIGSVPSRARLLSRQPGSGEAPGSGLQHSDAGSTAGDEPQRPVSRQLHALLLLSDGEPVWGPAEAPSGQ